LDRGTSFSPFPFRLRYELTFKFHHVRKSPSNSRGYHCLGPRQRLPRIGMWKPDLSWLIRIIELPRDLLADNQYLQLEWSRKSSHGRQWFRLVLLRWQGAHIIIQVGQSLSLDPQRAPVNNPKGSKHYRCRLIVSWSVDIGQLDDSTLF